MSESTTKQASSGVIATIISALPADVRGILSILLLFFAFYAVLFAFINMPTYFKNLASSSSTKEQCWELKEIHGGVFKFNKCSGETTQIEVKQPSVSTPPPTVKP